MHCEYVAAGDHPILSSLFVPEVDRGLSFLHYTYLAVFLIAHAANHRCAWLRPCVPLTVRANIFRFAGRFHLALALVGARLPTQFKPCGLQSGKRLGEWSVGNDVVW